MAQSPRSDRSVLRLVALALLVVLLITWIVYSVLWMPMAGPAAFLLVPAVAANSVAQSVSETLWPGSVFETSGLCQCDFPTTVAEGTAVEVAIEAGSRFVPTGAQWQDGRAVAQRSPDGGYLAMVSHSAPARAGGLYFFSPSQRWWNVYLDVYDAESGKKAGTFFWLRQLGEQPPRVQASWGLARALTWTAEVTSAPRGRCQPPPRVVAPSAFPGGKFSMGGATVQVVPVDDDGNGRMEGLRVEATFVAPRAGSYKLSARVGRHAPIAWYPGYAESAIALIEEASAEAVAGKTRLRIQFDARELAELRGSDPMVLYGVEVVGEGVQWVSIDNYSLSALPPFDSVPLAFTGESGTSFGSGVLEGSFVFQTPAGVCRWSGEVFQEGKRIPFSGSERFGEGSHEIGYKVQIPGWTATPELPIRIRMLTMECGGRSARLRRLDQDLATALVDENLQTIPR